MQPNVRQIPKELLDKAKDNKHLLMGYLFLALVFLGVLCSLYYWEYKAKVSKPDGYINIPKHVESGEKI
jgi:hypothetical protein